MRRRTVITLGAAAIAATALYPIWWPRRWRYIVVHHTAGGFGDVAFLRRVQQERFPNDRSGLIPYHFLIGNGNGIALGEVVQTQRWQQGLWGTHVKGAQRNLRGIGVCLVGNFEETNVPEAQYLSLVALVRDLMANEGIRPANVTLHKDTPGQQTLCPGRNFPKSRFISDISV